MFYFFITCDILLFLLFYFIIFIYFYYLTIIPFALVGYEVVNSQRGAKRRVGYNHSYPTRANGIIVLLNSSLV